MTDTDNPKPADKVWAMYDGPNCPDYITRGKWYEADENEDGLGFGFISDHGTQRLSSWRKSYHLSGDNWQRHVGPTPPDAKETAMQELSGLGQAYDAAPADGWAIHNGSAKRPKGVGKWDCVHFEFRTWFGSKPLKVIEDERRSAQTVDWSRVTRYRIIDRAPKKQKRGKVWIIESSDKHGIWYRDEDSAKKYAAVIGANAIPAKLTPVKDTDK